MVRLFTIIKINFLTNIRYKFNFINSSISIILVIFPALIMLVTKQNMYFGMLATDYLKFSMIAIACWSFIECFWAFVFDLRNQIREGTLDVVLLYPMNMLELILSWTLDGIISGVLQTIPLIVISSILSINYSPIFFIIIIIILFISCIASFSLASVFVSGLLIKPDFSQFVSFMGNCAPLVCGLIVPLKELPKIIQYFSYVFPFTWMFDLMRYYFSLKEQLISHEIEWIILIGLSCIYVIVGITLYKQLMIKARKNNNFSGY